MPGRSERDRNAMKDDSCIFCKIANGEIPSATVYEDDDFRAILDLAPAANGHTLILPKDHAKDLQAFSEDISLTGRAFALAARIGAAQKKALGADGFNVVQNNGTAAGQTVFHFHIHVIPRKEGGPVMAAWQPGQESDETRAKTAEALRAAL